MTGCPGEIPRKSIGRHCQDWDGGFFLSLKPRIDLAASYLPMSTSFFEKCYHLHILQENSLCDRLKDVSKH